MRQNNEKQYRNANIQGCLEISEISVKHKIEITVKHKSPKLLGMVSDFYGYSKRLKSFSIHL